MNTPHPLPLVLRVLPALLLAAAALPAQAEKADRLKPLVYTFNTSGEADMAKQRTELRGDVIISKGSLQLHAEKVDLRQNDAGYHQAYASGQAGKPVSFRQARDVAGEFVEGSADQVDYDEGTDVVRFSGSAVVRQMRGTLVVKELSGSVITYNSRTEVLQVTPKANERLRIVTMPSAGGASASEAAPAAALPLQPSTTLTPPRK